MKKKKTLIKQTFFVILITIILKIGVQNMNATISVSINADDITAVHELAAKQKRKLSAIVGDAIRQYLENEGEKK